VAVAFERMWLRRALYGVLVFSLKKGDAKKGTRTFSSEDALPGKKGTRTFSSEDALPESAIPPVCRPRSPRASSTRIDVL
jgi:hypothetical protein